MTRLCDDCRKLPDPTFKEPTFTKLGPMPPRAAEVETSWLRLRMAHRSLEGLFTTLRNSRILRARRTGSLRGRLTKDEQDVLRAAIVFTAATVDACLEELIRETTHVLVTHPGLASRTYGQFWGTRLENKSSLLFRTAFQDFLAEMAHPDLVDIYIEDRVNASFQKETEIKYRAFPMLGIAKDPIRDTRVMDLKDLLVARNDIVHRMDRPDTRRKDTAHLDPHEPQKRELPTTYAMCNTALVLRVDIIRETARNIRSCRKSAG